MSAFFSLIFLAFAVFIVVGRRSARQLTNREQHLRFLRFAEANGLEYVPGPTSFGRGDRLTRILHQEDRVLFANFHRMDGQAEDSVAPVTKFGGQAELKLPTELPRLLLVRRGFRLPSLTSPRAPLRSQRLRLEGECDRHFTLYCPAGYERDALYLLATRHRHRAPGHLAFARNRARRTI